MDIAEAARILDKFCDQNLTSTLAGIEASVQGLTSINCTGILKDFGTGDEVLIAAGQVKRLAGQINVIIHAAGILRCLPKILESGEVVEYVSLGAGNTGRSFDLETNRRVAEFKFIHWKGADSIRQNSLFKDFVHLAEHATLKRKFLYVLGTEYPLKFLNGRRAITSVLDKNATLLARFRTTFGGQFQTVRDYYQARASCVTLADVSTWVDGLADDAIDGQLRALR